MHLPRPLKLAPRPGLADGVLEVIAMEFATNRDDRRCSSNGSLPVVGSMLCIAARLQERAIFDEVRHRLCRSTLPMSPLQQNWARAAICSGRGYAQAYHALAEILLGDAVPRLQRHPCCRGKGRNIAAAKLPDRMAQIPRAECCQASVGGLHESL